MAESTFDLDIALATKLLASDLVPIVTEGAERVKRAWQAQIQLTELPSDPGEPPASPTRKYFRSIRAGRAYVFPDAVVASAFSQARTADDRMWLADALDGGYGNVLPRPHIQATIELASGQVRSLVRESGGS